MIMISSQLICNSETVSVTTTTTSCAVEMVSTAADEQQYADVLMRRCSSVS